MSDLRDQAIKAIKQATIVRYGPTARNATRDEAAAALDGLLGWLRENADRLHQASGHLPIRETVQPSQVRVVADLLSEADDE